LIADPRCADDITRGGNHALINEVMAEWCACRTREEAAKELERVRIPCGPVYDLGEVLADPQVNARGLLEPIEQAGSESVPLSQTPVRMNGEQNRLTRAPALGEHTDEVMSEIGFSKEEIAGLREAVAI
jgi:crotonobetainyl-CoA:carnitine CoA-transferase CaiB-like acyl-CoA transferase